MTQPQRPQRLLLVNADGLQLPSPAQAPLELALVEAGFVVVA